MNMKDTLRKIGKDCTLDENTERTKWLLKWPGQLIIAINQVRWSEAVEQAILSSKLEDFDVKSKADLADVVELIRADLTSLERMTLSALIVIDVHAQYVIEALLLSGTDNITDFDWISIMRYYVTGKDLNIETRMITSTLIYQYEYLGNSGRLVITPLTDRCYRTLMGAYQFCYGGAPEGPAGTGKTETVKDLGKAVAVQCVVFNCSDQINTTAMSKFFKGLSQSGSWCCFDEFNRIEPDVLSVIAEQVRTIQTAVRMKQKTFLFEGSNMPLSLSAAINITMNPGYAGRSDLPDNLKALFRTCAMMVPDYVLISEIMLYSYGYQTAKKQATKTVASLHISSEQLSSQKHYDFGMRSLKAILVAAGKLKRTMGHIDEDSLCLRALEDVNIPKFTKNDIPLFKSITSDLFPKVKAPYVDYTKLSNKVREVAHEQKISAEPVLIEKVIQLYETLLVRHGLMLVGRTFSGKSMAINNLKQALTEMDGEGDFRRTRIYLLNPKSITGFQLYGKLDNDTKQWTDGILPVIMVECENDGANPERKWVLFDGPVDAVWIENMNTVLDDNKVLCLTNGQKIKVTPQMTLMFEVEDLFWASPATVSRCGMVFLEPVQLGWKPLVKSYVEYHMPEFMRPSSDYIIMNTEWMLEATLGFVIKNSKFPWTMDESVLTNQMLKVFDVTLKELVEEEDFDDEMKNKKEKKEWGVKELENICNNVCLFATIWGIGGVLEEASRHEFHLFLMKLIYFDNVRDTYKLDLDPEWEPRGISLKLNDPKS